MIETFAVAGILVLSAVFLIFTFFSYTSLFLNLVIILALYFLIKKDLKDRDNHKYYLVSLLLTAMFFISSTAGFVNSLLVTAQRMLLSIVTVAIIGVYAFAHLMAFIHQSYSHLKEKYKR